MLLAAVGCEYGDMHGSAESFDLLLGLKVKPKEILALRMAATIDLLACFIFEFPESSKTFFDNPPPSLYDHPIPMSYEKDKIFVKWRKTPFAHDHIHFLTRFLQRAKSLGLPENHIAILNNLSTSTNGLYAVSYENSGGECVSNVGLFVLDQKKRILYSFTITDCL